MTFDPYEFIAVIIPGALPTFAASLLVPEIANVLSTEGVELGEFGIFLIVSFVVGHVVQWIGNLIENAEDHLGVGKRDLPFAKKRPIPEDQWARFEKCVSQVTGEADRKVGRDNYSTVIREVYSHLQAAQKTQRIDVFNPTYGLCRGMVAGALLTTFLILLLGTSDTYHYAGLVFAVLAVPLYVRMRRFSRLYMTEIVSQFLALRSEPPKGSHG